LNPDNAIHAVVHPDPYPYYANLRTQAPFFHDPALGLWIAASAAAVTEVLASPDCRVRPATEPTPAAIAGTPAGEVFAQLVRMNDGARHTRPRQALQRALADIDLAAARELAERIAARNWSPEAQDWTRWTFEVPVSTVAALLGFVESEQPAVAAWTRDFVACLSPLSGARELGAASAAAQALCEKFNSMLRQGRPLPGTLAAAVVDAAHEAGWEQSDGMVANLVGLLSQTCEASAGWIGNCIVALHTQPGLRATVLRSPDSLEPLVDEVSRFDPAIQNTRRFVVRSTRIAGQALQAGDAILVLLAAAGRDPAVNPAPDTFDIDRPARRVFGFGHGIHACPGHALARAIVIGALRQFLRYAMPETRSRWSYRPSVNARIPVFHAN
jgi:cytochrome P450